MSEPAPPAPQARMVCPQCRKTYRIAGFVADKNYLCPSCRTGLVPMGSAPPDSARSASETMPPAAGAKPPVRAPLPPTMHFAPTPDSPEPAAGPADDLELRLSGESQGLDQSDLKQLLPPEFHGYRVLKEIARGGMGVVLLAEQSQLWRQVALKVMMPSAETSDPAAKERFLREARSMARLKHPHIIAVYDVGSVSNLPYFSMEFIEGRTLSDLVERRKLGTRQAVEVLAKVARALGFAHAQGILHRDLKPANVMVRHNGEPVLMDFGLAKDINTQSLKLSVTGSVVGTPAYMSPEQAQGLDLDTRGDIYSLGAVLYEAVTGQVPFEGNTAFATLYQVINDVPRPAREINPEVPPDLSRVCAKALEKDIRDRYATMEEMAADLERWLAGETVQAQGPALTTRARQWVKTHKAVCIAAGTALAACALFLLLILAGVLRPAKKAGETRKALVEGSAETRIAHIQALAGDLREGRLAAGTREHHEALAALHQAAADGEPKVAAAALATLAEADRDGAGKLCLSCLAPDKPVEVRRAALAAVAKLRPQGSSLALAEMMQKDTEVELRLAAVEAMGDTVEPGVMTRLMETATRGTPRAVAEAARRKLTKLRPAQSIVGLYAGSRVVPHADAVAGMLKAKGEYERQLENALEEINPDPTPKKVERIPEPFELAAAKLQAGSRDERLMAAYDLGVLAKAESEEPLERALKDEDADVALAAAESLGKLPQVKAPDKLVELLSVEKAALPGTRRAAARACGLVKPPPDGARVAAALSAEKDAGVQVELAQTLGRLKPPGAAAPLVALLSDGAPAAKAKAAWALGQLGDKAVCGDLVSALEKAGNDAELKEELAGALSALTGKSLGTDAAKWRAALK